MFNQPEGIAVNSGGDVYVTDTGNGRVCRSSAGGASLAAWDAAGVVGGGFQMLKRIAVGASGTVCTTEVRRIQRFGANGDPYDQWPGTADDGKPVKLQGIAVDADGNVYVTDRTYGRALKFSAQGGFLAKYGLYGIDPGNFQDPVDIAVGPSGTVFVLDRTHVHRLSSNLAMGSSWGSEGDGPGELDGAEGIGVSPGGRVYVADSGNARVQVFEEDGTFVSQFGVGADAEGCFLHPRDVAVSAGGFVYVLDSGRQAVLKFAWTTDTNLPETRVYGVDKKWHNQTVEITFKATDKEGPVSHVKVRSRDPLLPIWDPWVELPEDYDESGTFMCEVPAEPDHGNDGEHLLEYCAVDLSGNEEKPKRLTVRIDTQAPRVTVVKVKPAKVKWGERVTVAFRVQEQLSPKVQITGVVYKPDGVVVVHGAESGWMPRKGLFGWSFTCRLKPGQYKIAVQARDLAGNESEATTKASADFRVE